MTEFGMKEKRLTFFLEKSFHHTEKKGEKIEKLHGKIRAEDSDCREERVGEK